MSDARERVLKNTPEDLLQGYFDQKELDSKALAENEPRQRLFLFKRLSTRWDSQTLAKVLDDFDRVDALAGQESRIALIEAAPNREALLAQQNEYGRAMWLFLQGETFFERASEPKRFLISLLDVRLLPTAELNQIVSGGISSPCSGRNVTKIIFRTNHRQY